MEGEGSEGPVAARGNCKTLDRTVAASATGAVTGAPLVIACRGGRDSTGFCGCLARLPQLEWACLSTVGLSDIRLRLVELSRRLLLDAESRDMLEKVRELSEPFFRNVIRFHNRLAESPVTEKLSMRLFYIVTQVKRGRGYREIGKFVW